MATPGSGPPSANEPKEDQIVVSATDGGGPPAEGGDMGATTGAGDTAGAREAQEAAAAALREEDASRHGDIEAIPVHRGYIRALGDDPFNPRAPGSRGGEDRC